LSWLSFACWSAVRAEGNRATRPVGLRVAGVRGLAVPLMIRAVLLKAPAADSRAALAAVPSARGSVRAAGAYRRPLTPAPSFANR
jgi:hypothetical protein